MYSSSFFVSLLFCFLLSACTGDAGSSDADTSSAAVQIDTYESRGVVKSITPSRNYINIDHEAIPGFMDAMAMMFSVKDTSIVSAVVVGDSISFEIEVGATSMPQVSSVSILASD